MDKQDIVQNYITLQEATTHCEYSQEYLSLRARSGKLKAVKIGRNWTTKKEWLDEYLATVENYKEYVEDCKAKKITKEENKEIIKEFTKQVVAPENLPVNEPVFFSSRLGIGFASVFASVLIIAGCVFGNSSLINVSQQADLFAKSVSLSGDIVVSGILDVSEKSVLAFSDNFNEMAVNIGRAEIAVIAKALNYSNKNIMAMENSVQKFVVNINESGIAVVKGIAEIPSKSIFATAKDFYGGVENINYAGNKILDCFVEKNIKDGSYAYIAFFNAINNTANDIGDSGDSLMTASVENFKTALDGVSALTYIVGNAGDEVIGGSLTGARDLTHQANRASSFVINNAKSGRSAIGLQASAFTDYSNWALNTIKTKIFSFGYSVKYLANNFQQKLGKALYSLKESIAEKFNNLSFAVSEKTENTFAFIRGIPDLLTGAPVNQIAETENLSSVASQNEKGIVAIPVKNGNEEATKETIKSFFSDEVEVSPQDADSGIIIPVFKEKKGGEYMYMMVPINNKN